MKKITIIVALLVVVVLAVPFMGNMVVQKEIDKNLKELSSFGATAKKHDVENSYFKTVNRLEIAIDDGVKFLEFINKYSAQTIPHEMAGIFNGAVIGVELEYLNFPISDKLALTIYPLEMPSEVEEALLQEASPIAPFLKEFFKNRGLLYQLNFHVGGGSFDGYLKDIKESIDLEDNLKVSLELIGAKYKGEGTIIEPTAVSSFVDIFKIEASDNMNELIFEIKDISTESKFENEYTYQSSLEAKAMNFNLKDYNSNMKANFKESVFAAGVNANKAKVKGNVQTSIKEADVEFEGERIAFKDFNHALFVSEIDKDSYIKIVDLVKEADNNIDNINQVALERALVELLSKGLVVDLKDLSIKSLVIGGNDLKGLSAMAKITLKPLQRTVYDIRSAVAMLEKNMLLDAKLKISKEMFQFISNQAPMMAIFVSFAKDEGDSYLFDVKYGDDSFTVNGEPLM